MSSLNHLEVKANSHMSVHTDFFKTVVILSMVCNELDLPWKSISTFGCRFIVFTTKLHILLVLSAVLNPTTQAIVFLNAN